VIVSGFTDIALLAFKTGRYNYDTNVFKVAVYTSDSVLDPSITAYTTTGELSASGTGYTAGGYTLTNSSAAAIVGRALNLSWATYTTPNLTASDIKGAVVYNTTVSNEAVLVIDFGNALTKAAQPLLIKFPDSVGDNAVGSVQLRAV
jgi:hypothetical protein